ncbi:MAG: hypothetical protein Q9170_003927 [Blastenia crenularia]
MSTDMDKNATEVINQKAHYHILPLKEQWDTTEDTSIASADSNEDGEEVFIGVEPFEEYELKINQLLVNIGFPKCEVEALQHGPNFSNRVYALTSEANAENKYILRVPMEPEFREDDGVCEAVLNDAAILGFLADKLPVPRVLAYSATAEKALEEPYMLQTRLPGISLNQVYEYLGTEEKFAVIDQYVELISKLEAVTFPTAGTFAASVFEPLSANEFSPLAEPSVTIFNQGNEDFVEKPGTILDRAGSDVISLLRSHIDGWLEQERKFEEQYNNTTGKVPYYNKLKEILEATNSELQLIVLHHWDLEARNIMVAVTPDGYRITDVIDWDEALAYPRNLARRAPDWIWDFRYEEFTGYKDADFHPHLELSDEALELKAYFDEKARSVLGNRYLEDAYGTGRLLRRIWYLVKESMHSTLDFDLMQQLCEEYYGLEEESRLQSEVLLKLQPQVEEPELLLPELPMAGQQAVDLDPVSDTSLGSDEQPASPVQVRKLEPPASLWVRITFWFRSSLDNVRMAL